MTTAFGIWLALFGIVPAPAPAESAMLRVTVVDPSNAIIVGARVELKPIHAAPLVLDSDGRGQATFNALEPGRYDLHVDSPGFESYDLRDLRLHPGETKRTVKLSIARLAETVVVGRDARERASDPRSDAFATVLGQREIDELPDDPDEMEQMLKDMAGPGAVLRVNGFHGGRLPPKDQIAQIRFHRNMFAADAHEPGVLSVDIITKPGVDAWRGATNVGFRDDALSARNAFAPTKGDERNQRLAFSLSGPLWRKHTSLFLSADLTDAYDTKTFVAALPQGYFSGSVRKPADTVNVSMRLEHGVTPAQMLRVEAQRNTGVLDNLGIGDFDLVERRYRQTRGETVVRGSLAGSFGKKLFNELRMQWRSQEWQYTPASQAPAVIVLNAFNSGGAQIAGSEHDTTGFAGDDLDIAYGRHALRTGFLFEGGTYRTGIGRNTGGTFTFSDLAAYSTGRPATFAWNAGDPNVAVTVAQLGAYVQDDYRASKSLTLSAGVRHEYQSTIGGANFGPRGGVMWSPFRNGKTTIRAGAGVFFDWFDAQSYEQAAQLDGEHQRTETIVDPGYPNPASGAGAVLFPDGRVVLSNRLVQPTLSEATLGVEEQLPGSLRLNTIIFHRAGSHGLRAVNVNAPRGDGSRPDPDAGAIADIQSTASSSVDGVSVNLNFARPDKRIFIAANYTLSRATDETDSPLSVAADASNLAAERGPALTDARHRAMGFANVPLFAKLTLGTSFRVQSGLPYNITTGRDNNNDTIINDRPAGTTRNTGRGSATVDISTRLTWRIGLGGGPPPAPPGPQIHVVRGGADSNPLDTIPGTAPTRYSLDVYVQVFNVLNHVNALNFSGVQTSPFFGRATSAGPPRRAEIGVRFAF